MSTPTQVDEQEELVNHQLSRRVVIECNTSGSKLALGKIVTVSNGVDIFKPAMSVDLSPEEKTAFAEKDWSRGIVTDVVLKSVSSNCPEPVTVGLNLFEGTPNIINSSGWLYAKQTNDMTDDHAHQNDGFTNVVTVLPNEVQRLNEVLYTPENVVNNSYITKYGGFTEAKLWENLIEFPTENYHYVPEDHVVMKIIAGNWDQLGIAPEQEMKREGKYIKIASDVVKQCISQLYDNVIKEIPYTNFNKFGARFQARTEGSERYKVVCEMLVKYKFP